VKEWGRVVLAVGKGRNSSCKQMHDEIQALLAEVFEIPSPSINDL